LATSGLRYDPPAGLPTAILCRCTSIRRQWCHDNSVNGLDIEVERPAGVSIFLLCQALPGLIVGTLAGAAADRGSRKRIVVLADTVRAILALCLLPLGPNSLWLIYILVASRSSAGTFAITANQALVPRVVGRDLLGAAYAWLSGARNIGRVIGMAFGGIVVADRAWTAFALDALCFASAALLRWRISAVDGAEIAGKLKRPAGGWTLYLEFGSKCTFCGFGYHCRWYHRERLEYTLHSRDTWLTGLVDRSNRSARRRRSCVGCNTWRPYNTSIRSGSGASARGTRSVRWHRTHGFGT